MLDVIIQQTRELRCGKKKKATDKDSIAFVPHIGVEPMIYCVRGSCPGPLDECGVLVSVLSTTTILCVVIGVISLLKSGAKVQLFFELEENWRKKVLIIMYSADLYCDMEIRKDAFLLWLAERHLFLGVRNAKFQAILWNTLTTSSSASRRSMRPLTSSCSSGLSSRIVSGMRSNLNDLIS